MGPKRKAAQEANSANKKVATGGGVAARKKSASAAKPAPKTTPKGPDNKNKRASVPASKPPKLSQPVIDKKRKNNAGAPAGNGATSQVRAASGLAGKEGQGQAQAARRPSVSQQAPQGSPMLPPHSSANKGQAPLMRTSISSLGQHNGSVNPFAERLQPLQSPIHSGQQSLQRRPSISSQEHYNDLHNHLVGLPMSPGNPLTKEQTQAIVQRRVSGAGHNRPQFQGSMSSPSQPFQQVHTQSPQMGARGSLMSPPDQPHPYVRKSPQIGAGGGPMSSPIQPIQQSQSLLPQMGPESSSMSPPSPSLQYIHRHPSQMPTGAGPAQQSYQQVSPRPKLQRQLSNPELSNRGFSQLVGNLPGASFPQYTSGNSQSQSPFEMLQRSNQLYTFESQYQTHCMQKMSSVGHLHPQQQQQTRQSRQNPNVDLTQMNVGGENIVNGSDHRVTVQGEQVSQRPQNSRNRSVNRKVMGPPPIRLRNADGSGEPISSASHSPLTRPNVNPQDPEGRTRLDIHASTRLLNRHGQPDESSAETQASPVIWGNGAHSPLTSLNTQAPALPHGQVLSRGNHRREFMYSPSEEPVSDEAPIFPQAQDSTQVNIQRESVPVPLYRQSPQMEQLQQSNGFYSWDTSNGNEQTGGNNQDLEMTNEPAGMPESMFGEVLPPPIDSLLVTVPPNTIYSSDACVSSPTTKSDKEYFPEQSTTSGGPPAAEFQSPEIGHILGSSPPTESVKPHKSATQTPRQWATLAITKSHSPPTNSHTNRDFDQVEEDTGLGIMLSGDLSNTINTPTGNFDLNMSTAHLSGYSTPQLPTKSNTGHTSTLDSSSAPMIPPFQPLARPASPKTVKHKLHQRYEDGMAGLADQSEQDTRRNGLAAQILGRMNHSLNKPAPQPRQTAFRSTASPDFKHLGIASIRKADEKPRSIFEECSWCYFETDFGLANDSCLLDAKALRSFCADCHATQHNFMKEYGTATRGAEITAEETDKLNVLVKKWNLQAQFSPLNEAVILESGQTLVQAAQAKKLPQNTKSVSDGRNVAPYRGIITCRGSAHGQVDVKKALICGSCKEEKFRIIKHDKHTDFHPIPQLQNMRGPPHSRRCMICCSSATDACTDCPLRLCGACQVLLMCQCKGYLNNLFYHYNSAHLRNDAFLLRSDGGGF